MSQLAQKSDDRDETSIKPGFAEKNFNLLSLHKTFDELASVVCGGI